MLMAFVGFKLISGARPGWTMALRRKGTLGDAFLRAAIAAAGAAGIARWARVIFSRVPSLYEPDPSLPSSLETKFPSIDVLWSTGRGIFFLAALAAVAALALRGRFFQTVPGRVLGALAVLVALLPSGFHSGTEFVTDALPTVLGAAWLAAAVGLLLRDHAAAWVFFALFSLGLRDATDLAVQPAAADRASGGVAILLLAGAAVALLAGRRDRRVPQPVPIEPTRTLIPESPLSLEPPLPRLGGEGGDEGGAPPTTPSSGSA
jgi:hypothetical protein